MKYKELVEEWLEEKKHYVKESTYALYAYEMRAYILPMLGKYEIAEITEDVLQNCTFQWQEMPSNDGKPRKNSVIQNWIVLVKQMVHAFVIYKAIRVIHPVVFRFYIYFLHILLTFLFFYEWINYFHRFFCFCTFCMNSQIYRF